jgi:putative endonuclease
MKKLFYVYILASKKNGTIYTGVTNNLFARVFQHKNKEVPGFTERYNVNKLVYFEETDDVAAGIEREKQIKGWIRNKKLKLIETTNPEWKDLSDGWYE